MNTKSNFFTGLGLGIVVSAISFLFIAASVRPALVTPGSDANAIDRINEVDQYKGGFIPTADASALIAAYTSDFIEANNLPSNTTIGGFIGKENLKQVTATMNEDQYIKFSFYLEEDAAGNAKIGLIFYPDANPSTVLRTGPSSFCPTLCNPPQ